MAKGDGIYIRDLQTRCIVGINPEERVKMQDVIINIRLDADLDLPGETDDIGDTVDYKTLKDAVIAHVEASEYFLIERLASAIADLCLGFRGVGAVRVTVDKPGALRFARSVAVEITREQQA